MSLNLSTGSKYHRSILDALPHPVMLIEEGLRVVDSNAAARKFFVPGETGQPRPGEALGCVHAKEIGCGARPVCATCPIRVSIGEALQGQYPPKQIVRVIMAGGARVTEMAFIMTVAPLYFENLRLAMMVLEDPREMASLQKTLRICSGCKQVRGNENEWQSVEIFLSRHLDIHCTHSLCPDCARKFFPEYADILHEKEDE